MHSNRSVELFVQKCFFTVFPETNSIHPRKRHSSRRLFTLAAFFFFAFGFSGTMPGQRTSASTLSFSPASASFGSMLVGSSNTLAVTVKNAGTTTVMISSQWVNAQDYTVTGLSLPSKIAAGSSAVFWVKFAPTGSTVARAA